MKQTKYEKKTEARFAAKREENSMVMSSYAVARMIIKRKGKIWDQKFPAAVVDLAKSFVIQTHRATKAVRRLHDLKGAVLAHETKYSKSLKNLCGFEEI